MNTQAGGTTSGGLFPLIIIIASLLLVVFFICMVIKTSKGIKKMQDSGMTLRGTFNHINGLNMAENTPCEVLSYLDRYEFISGALKFNLLKSKVVDVTIKTDADIQKQYVSSLAGTVGGAVLFGPVGAIIGGRAKQKKIKTISQYLIITYKADSEELKYIGFEVTNSSFMAKNFLNEFKETNTTVTDIEL